MKKPDLTAYFNSMPYIGRYMAYDYECANSLTAMIDLVHEWLNEADISTNVMRKIHFQQGANLIYGLITSRTFETKKFEDV